MIGLMFLPDSPRWLASKGRTEEAHDVVARLLGHELDHPDVIAELNGIQESIYIQNRGGGFKYRELFTNGPSQNFRRTFLGALSQFCQQFCGINLVVSLREILWTSTTPLTDPRPTMLPTFSKTLLGLIPTYLDLSRPSTGQSTSWLLFSPFQQLIVSVAAL